MKTERYNGWKNHATWCVNLHLTNTQEWANSLYGMARSAIAAAPNSSQVKSGTWKIKDAEIYKASELIKEFVSYQAEHDAANSIEAPQKYLVIDLIRGYLSEVDWDEIARAAIESVRA